MATRSRAPFLSFLDPARLPLIHIPSSQSPSQVRVSKLSAPTTGPFELTTKRLPTVDIPRVIALPLRILSYLGVPPIGKFGYLSLLRPPRPGFAQAGYRQMKDATTSASVASNHLSAFVSLSFTAILVDIVPKNLLTTRHKSFSLHLHTSHQCLGFDPQTSAQVWPQSSPIFDSLVLAQCPSACLV